MKTNCLCCTSTDDVVGGLCANYVCGYCEACAEAEPITEGGK